MPDNYTSASKADVDNLKECVLSLTQVVQGHENKIEQYDSMIASIMKALEDAKENPMVAMMLKNFGIEF